MQLKLKFNPDLFPRIYYQDKDVFPKKNCYSNNTTFILLLGILKMILIMIIIIKTNNNYKNKITIK